MLTPGGTLFVPVRKDTQVHIHPVVIEAVRRCDDETLYCLRDKDGPAMWLRRSRLTQLRRRLLPDLLPQ